MENFPSAFIGGLLVGLAAVIFLLFSGRIAGNSGIAGGLFSVFKDKAFWRLFYVIGLVSAGLFFRWYHKGQVDITIDATVSQLIVAGFLVGIGTRLGNGCTSGHGICGLARLSRRSIGATIIFMSAGILTVLIVKGFGG